MVAIDDVIWPVVQQHPWKYRTRQRPISGILWHATRSGQAQFSPETEYSATLNWFRSPNNVVRDDAGKPWYGGMSNYVIGGGRVCLAVPEEFSPRYSAGVHDDTAISVEVAQPLPGMAYDPRDIALCKRLADDLAERYSIPRGRLDFVDGAVFGEVGHEDTAQGRGQGKSDPGPLFWQAYLEDDMADPRVDALVAALTGLQGGDPNAMKVLDAWNANGNSLLAGYAGEQKKLADHVANHAAAVAGPVPDHTHVEGKVKR